MTRIHGRHTCWLCGRVAAIGWVYLCEEDDKQRTICRRIDDKRRNASVEISPCTRTTIERADGDSEREEMLNELYLLDFSDSVVDTARQGLYSADQLKKLIAQKRKVHAVTRPTLLEKIGNGFASRIPGEFPKTPPSTPQKLVPSASPIPTHRHDRSTTLGASCALQCCHICKPFYKDRCYWSLESVLREEPPLLAMHDTSTLPWHDAGRLLQIGLREAS